MKFAYSLLAVALLAASASAQCPGGKCSMLTPQKPTTRQTVEPPLIRAAMAPVRALAAVPGKVQRRARHR